MITLTLGLVVKCWTLLVSAFGAICGVVIWFYPAFSAGGFMVGLDMIILNVLIFVSEVIPLPVFDYLRILNVAWGKGAWFFFIGALWGGTAPLWISCWVIFWLTGALWVVLNFIPTFRVSPPLLAESEPGQPDHDKPVPTEKYSQLE